MEMIAGILLLLALVVFGLIILKVVFVLIVPIVGFLPSCFFVFIIIVLLMALFFDVISSITKLLANGISRLFRRKP